MIDVSGENFVVTVYSLSGLIGDAPHSNERTPLTLSELHGILPLMNKIMECSSLSP